jgi:hypothetical protein
MKTYRNAASVAVTVEFCVDESCSPETCVKAVHVVEPGALFTFDDDADNGSAIEELIINLGLELDTP